MRLNTKCSIALHCLIFIYQYSNTQKVTSELLAKSTGCNSVVIRKILSNLQKAEIIRINRSVGGSYLNREPDKITFWEIYHALEPDGLDSLIAMHPNSSQSCSVGKSIYATLQEPYQQISKAVESKMKQITLQTFLDCYMKQLNTTENI